MLALNTRIQNIYTCNQICFHTTFVTNCMLNTSLASILVLNNDNQLQYSHDLVVGVRWSKNELVVVVIHKLHKNLNT